MSKKGPGYSINVRDDGTTEVEITATITEITLPAYKLKEISDRIAELEQVVADWKSDYDTLLKKLYEKDEKISELKHKNALLRAVAEAAQDIMGEAKQDEIAGSAYCVVHSDYLLNLHGFTQAAIDGGALDKDGEK